MTSDLEITRSMRDCDADALRHCYTFWPTREKFSPLIDEILALGDSYSIYRDLCELASIAIGNEAVAILAIEAVTGLDEHESAALLDGDSVPAVEDVRTVLLALLDLLDTARQRKIRINLLRIPPAHNTIRKLYVKDKNNKCQNKA